MKHEESSAAAPETNNTTTTTTMQELEDRIRALQQERDQLKVNLYLLATNLKELGFQISDQANTIQRLGTDIISRMKLTPTQMHMIQRQISPQEPPQT